MCLWSLKSKSYTNSITLVANTKHLPVGIFPDKEGKFPDGTEVKDFEKEAEEDATVTAILFKQALKHLDETKGQKAQTGTKPVSHQPNQS